MYACGILQLLKLVCLSVHHPLLNPLRARQHYFCNIAPIQVLIVLTYQHDGGLLRQARLETLHAL